MRTVKIRTAALLGVRGVASRVEVTLRQGSSGFSAVGVGARVLEVRTRVRSAIENSGFDWPSGQVAVTTEHPYAVHMDLAAAIGILEVSGQLDAVGAEALAHVAMLGELALDGRLRPIRGAYPLGAATGEGAHPVICPDEWAEHVALGADRTHGAIDLAGVVTHLRGFKTLRRVNPLGPAPDRGDSADLADVRGCVEGIAALERAAVSGRGLILRGPPGVGKTMLARRLPSILPPMTREEVLEVAAIQSVAGLLGAYLPGRPFRAPHHSVSEVGLVGGGVHNRPGEVTLAHNGMLFLDELPEFRRHSLDALASALRAGVAAGNRPESGFPMPTRPLLVASVNPCPCGYLGHPRQPCSCSPDAVRAYEARWRGTQVSDFFAEVVDLPAVTAEQLRSASPGESSATVRARVVAARQKEEA